MGLDMLMGKDFPPVFVAKYSGNYEQAKHSYQEMIRAIHRLEAARGVPKEQRRGEREGGLVRPERLNASCYYLAPAGERRVGHWWHEAQFEMGLTPNYECVDPDRYVPEDFHQKVEFVDL
eukprot:4459297-Alexandrium_andersonii.AAC.1